MNLYECVFVLTGNITEKIAHEKIKKYEEVVEKSGGKTLKKEYWGLRTLAYKIKKNTKGHYFLINFNSTHQPIKEIENKLKIDDDHLRFLNLRIKEISKEPSIMLKKFKEEQ
tara:strand:+ start:711 stop:1046 length:336 start_codon:yes stop_codon:yes gene_type:complete